MIPNELDHGSRKVWNKLNTKCGDKIMLFLRNRRKLVPDEIYDYTLQIIQLMEEGEKRSKDLKTAGCITVAHSDFLNLCVRSAQLDT